MHRPAAACPFLHSRCSRRWDCCSDSTELRLAGPLGPNEDARLLLGAGQRLVQRVVPPVPWTRVRRNVDGLSGSDSRRRTFVRHSRGPTTSPPVELGGPSVLISATVALANLLTLDSQ